MSPGANEDLPSPTPRSGDVAGGGPLSRTVQIREVHHTFGTGDNQNVVLCGNNLDLYAGEIVILTGKSGSGKTTLLTLIGGLRQIQKGSIKVWGRELGDMNPVELADYRRRVGFIFQAHNLFGSLSAYQNVRLALELESHSEAQIRKRAVELLTRLKLGERIDFKPSKISGGQRQRVAIARALANYPQLILADEPTAALDEESAQIVVGLLKELASEHGSTIIIVTHDNKILDAADRIVNMSYGKIVSNSNVKRIEEICEFLRNSGLFVDKTPAELSEVASKMADEVHPAGAVVIQQGSRGDNFYLIRRGTVEVVVADADGHKQHRASLTTGQFFGEQALMYDKPRNATVVATSDLELYALSEEDFVTALKASPSFDSQVRSVLAQRQ